MKKAEKNNKKQKSDWSFLSFFFDQATLNSWSSCLCFLSVGDTDTEEALGALRMARTGRQTLGKAWDQDSFYTRVKAENETDLLGNLSVFSLVLIFQEVGLKCVSLFVRRNFNMIGAILLFSLTCWGLIWEVSQKQWAHVIF